MTNQMDNRKKQKKPRLWNCFKCLEIKAPRKNSEINMEILLKAEKCSHGFRLFVALCEIRNVKIIN